MSVNKKLPSLRAVVLMTVGSLLLLFLLIMLLLLNRTISSIATASEEEAFEKQVTVARVATDMQVQEISSITYDLAAWEETASYIDSPDPAYFSRNWPVKGPLALYRLHYMAIFDRSHTLLYEQSLSPQQDAALSQTLSRAVKPFSAEVLEKHSITHTFDVNDGASGLLYQDGLLWAVSVMPVFYPEENGPAAGTLVFARVLEESFFLSLELFDTSAVYVSAEKELTVGLHIETSDDGAAATDVLSDMAGNAVGLHIVREHADESASDNIIITTTIILFGVMLLFIMIVYVAIIHYALTPVEKLSASLPGAAHTGHIEYKKYATSREVSELGASINAMLDVLTQSSISIAVFQSIVNGMDAHLYVSDPETDELLFINDKMREYYNIQEDAVGRKCYEVFFGGAAERCAHCPLRLLERTKEGHAPYVWENHHANTGRTFRNTDCIIRWTDNRPVHMQHAFDITKIKDAEAALKERLEQQELLSSVSQSFLSSANVDWLIKNALQMTGEFLKADRAFIFSAEDGGQTILLQHDWYSLSEETVPLSSDTFMSSAFYKGFMETKKPYLLLRASDDGEDCDIIRSMGITVGLAVPLSISGAYRGCLVFDTSDQEGSFNAGDIQLARLVGNVISGVIARMLVEEKLIRMSSIVDSSPQYIAYSNYERQFEYFNKGVSDISGYSEEELLAHGTSLFYSDEVNQYINEVVIPKIRELGSFEFEIPLMRKDGVIRIMRFSSFNLSGQNPGIGSIATDVTKIRELEKELIAAKEMAERSNDAKSEFLSRMSHEMRTPMNAIIGMTSIARASREPEKMAHCLDKVDEASRHLLGVINDILDMSKIEANKFELNEAPFRFEPMLARVTNVIAFRVDEKRQTLITRLDPRVPATIISDEQRLAQVIANLLSNAVKFTPDHGAITLSVELREETSGGDVVLFFSCKDTGIGVSDEQQKRLFRSFEQADGSISRRFGGTGLGLAISKRIVELMGGKIWIESSPGEGANVCFTMRCLRATKEEEAILSAVTSDSQGMEEAASLENCFSGKHVLLAEDVAINQEILITLLAETGVSISCAQNGLEAAEMFEKDPTQYDMVFMDIHMPVMDGFKATRAIRALPHAWAKEVPILAMTANVFREDVEKCLAAGMNGHIGKPIDMDEIIKKMQEYLSSKGP
ncbi:response regulator [Christensenellaceae bacterium OttesenSCG-928-M15]|nr:response regulator [Christensenellaceae bacterium OttesenSCG-928-M15]